MYKKWSALLLVFLFILMINVSVAANNAPTVEVTFNRTTTAVTVSGNCALAEGSSVQLVALRPGSTFEALQSATQMETYMIRTDEATVAADGSFTFVPFVLSGSLPLGQCEVRVSCGGNAVTKSFYYSPLAKVIEALNGLDHASAEEIYTFLITDNNIEPLGLSKEDGAAYSELSQGTADKPQERDHVNRLLSSRNYAVASTADETTVNAMLQTLTADFKTAVAVGVMNDAKTAETVQQAIDVYGDVYDLEGNRQLYANLSTSQQKQAAADVLERIAKADRFDNVSALQDYYFLHSVLSVAGCAGWEQLESFLTTYRAVLELDLSGLQALSSYKKDSVMKALAAGDGFSSTDALQKALDKAIASVSSSSNGGSQSSGGGGGRQNTSGALINIGGNHTAAASETKVFNDIDHVSWAADSILTLYRKGIVNGRGNGEFCPDASVTRAEFIKMLIAACAADDEQSTVLFTDVPPEHWCYAYIARAAAMSIVQGYPDGSIGVNANITREDMAVMLSRLPQLKSLVGTEDQKVYNDAADIADYAKDAVEKISSLGIFSGDDAGCFRPQSVATRAETAKVVAGVLKKLS